MCCKVMSINELSKPVGLWCEHRKPGLGCGIYQDRPASCRAFSCLWLADPTQPHKLRPDLTKVVLYLDTDGRRLVARCDPANPFAWRRDPVYSALKRLARSAWGSGRTVIAVSGDRTWVIAPGEDVDVGELDERTPFSVEEQQDGRVRVTLLPPLNPVEDPTPSPGPAP